MDLASLVAHLSLFPLRQRFFTKLRKALGMPGRTRGQDELMHHSVADEGSQWGGGAGPKTNLQSVGTG